MTTALKSAARAVVDNILLAAVGRLAVPICLGVIGYAALQIVDFGQRLKVLEIARQQGRVEIIGRIESLESHDREDAKVNAQIIKQISALETGQSWMLRSLDRIESAVVGGPKHQ